MNKAKSNKIQRIINSLIIAIGVMNTVLGIITGNVVGTVSSIMVVVIAIVMRGLENE